MRREPWSATGAGASAVATAATVLVLVLAVAGFAACDFEQPTTLLRATTVTVVSTLRFVVAIVG